MRLTGERLAQERDLWHRARGQWRECAALLVQRGADSRVSIRGTVDADSPMYVAALVGDPNLIQALLEKGADPDGAKGAPETPLLAALGEQHREAAELLVAKGADLRATSRDRRTPLHFLAAFLDDPGLAERMIAKGADVRAKDKGGKLPLDLAVAAGHTQVAALLGRLAYGLPLAIFSLSFLPMSSTL